MRFNVPAHIEEVPVPDPMVKEGYRPVAMIVDQLAAEEIAHGYRCHRCLYPFPARPGPESVHLFLTPGAGEYPMNDVKRALDLVRHGHCPICGIEQSNEIVELCDTPELIEEPRDYEQIPLIERPSVDLASWHRGPRKKGKR